MEDNNKYMDSILATINKELKLYKVPEGYFSKLPEQVLEKAQNQAFSDIKVYSVPEGYFNSFAENILQKVKNVSSTNENEVEEELKTIAPLLNNISKNNVYSIPDGYFELLPSSLIKKEDLEQRESKIIQLHPKRKTWRTLAAAAVIAGAIFSGGLYFENNRNENTNNHSPKQYASAVSQSNVNLQENLSDLSDDEIISYLNMPSSDVDSASIGDSVSEATQKAISSMTNEELENYLDKSPANF